MSALTVEGLTVRYLDKRSRGKGACTMAGECAPAAVLNLSFSIDRGETLALVGESGSGKSTAGFAILGLLPEEAYVSASRLQLDDIDLMRASPRQMNQLRGGRIGMVFQDAMSALNPLMTIGQQVAEAVRLHPRGSGRMSRREAHAEALALLQQVGIPQAQRRMQEYPHRLSGGMRQRVVIAIALAGRPDILIADEPTTALDVTVQAQILDCLRTLQRERGLAIVLITHDLGVVAEMADKVLVMRHGTCVEQENVHTLFSRPGHSYTRQLLAARPQGGTAWQ